MRFKIVIVVITILFLGFAIFAASKRESNIGSGESSQIVSSENMYDFGTISMKDGVVSHTYNISNTGSDMITVNRVYSSCACTEVSFAVGDYIEGPFGMLGHGEIPKINYSFESGQKAQIIADYDPAAHGSAGLGDIERSVFIETGHGPKIELKFKVKVTP